MVTFTKRGALFGIALLCVLFSFSTLWKTQSVTISTTQQVLIPSIEPVILTAAIGTPSVGSFAVVAPTSTPSFSSAPSLSTPSMIASKAASPSSSPSPTQLLLSTANSIEASSTPTPFSSISPSSPLSLWKSSTPTVPSKSITPSPTPKSPSPSPASPSASPSNYAIFISSSLHGNRTTDSPKKLYDFETTINTPMEIHVNTLFNTSHPFWFNTSEPSEGQIIIPLRNETETNFTITFVPPQWFSGISQFEWRAKDTQNVKFFGKVTIRIRTGVVLNYPLLTTPTNYLFDQNDWVGTRGIESTFLWWKEHEGPIPKHDTWLNRRYNTCAVVGNGGSLRGRKRGAEIDSHDVVVRLNLSPFLNYTEDVGSKLNISVSNGAPATATECWTRKPEQLPVNATFEILTQATVTKSWLKLEPCIQKNPQLTYTPMSYLFVDLVDSILNEYHTQNFNGTGKRYRSTGMLAVTAMAMICDHVSVYGFERGPNMENNYYDSSYDREWSGHSYVAEKAFYVDLARGTGLFEKYLNLYDLYKSFSYIVD